GGIVGLADISGLADERGHVDDPTAAARDHVGEGGLGHKKRAGQVDRQHRVPVLVGHRRHSPVDGNAGVVDQDVDPAVLVDDLGEGAPAVRSGRYVALVQAGAYAQLLLEVVGECLRMRTVASVTGGNGGVLVAETTTNRRANTASASCHESHSV